MRHGIRGWIEIEPVAPDGNMFSPGWVHGCFSYKLNWCILYHSAFKICNLWYLLPLLFCYLPRWARTGSHKGQYLSNKEKRGRGGCGRAATRAPAPRPHPPLPLLYTALVGRFVVEWSPVQCPVYTHLPI